RRWPVRPGPPATPIASGAHEAVRAPPAVLGDPAAVRLHDRDLLRVASGARRRHLAARQPGQLLLHLPDPEPEAPSRARPAPRQPVPDLHAQLVRGGSWD